VAEGALYRCGQPTPDELAGLIARLSLRTVVSFRGQRDAADPDRWEQAERDVCRAHAVEFVTIPCNHKNPPTRAQAVQFLDLFRGAEHQPVLVHCRLGQQRTLLFCALYRVHWMGLAPEEAEREMDALGFGARKRRHRKLLETFQVLAREPLVGTSSVR
jgi:protein tyrosine/serine phosphatase